jgi:hypothetical protein
MIGLIELTCVVLYLISRTAVPGAVLMMGLPGGAMATQIRAGSPLFSHIQHLSWAVHVGRVVAAGFAGEGAFSDCAAGTCAG